jgi:hypothetical protein
MSAPEPASRDANLANLILALLTPMFLWSTAGDIRLAHVAAAQTLNEFRIANRLSLFTVAKIIAFDIATLSSLSLSMYEDVSMLLALRLRGNATSLDRSAERNRRRFDLEQASRPDAGTETEDSIEAAIAEAQRMVDEANARIRASAAQPAETQPDAVPAAEATPAPAPVPATTAIPAARTSTQQRQSAWADAMTAVARESTDGLKDLPPAERWKEMARIEALTMAAADLASGTAPPPVLAMAAE